MKTERLITKDRAQYVELNWCDKCRIEERYKVMREELKNLSDSEVANMAFFIIQFENGRKGKAPHIPKFRKIEKYTGSYARPAIYNYYKTPE